MKNLSAVIVLSFSLIFGAGCSKKSGNANTSAPEVLVTEVTRQDVPIVTESVATLVPYADAGLLQAKLVKNARLKVYKGTPHGMCTMHKHQVNEDLLAFIEEDQQSSRKAA
jgi:hypothetical protein